MKKMTLLGAVASTVLSGCGTAAFVPPKAQPMLSHELKDGDGKVKIITMATTAERRNIYFTNDGHACFEPPPDTAEAISSSFSAALQASASSSPSLAASLGNNFATAVASLSKRSQGVILFRDAAFNLC